MEDYFGYIVMCLIPVATFPSKGVTSNFFCVWDFQIYRKTLHENLDGVITSLFSEGDEMRGISIKQDHTFLDDVAPFFHVIFACQ